MRFKPNGDLYQTITLTYDQFHIHFATNPDRERLLANALRFFRIFHSCGARRVFVGGSFVSRKPSPEDIDLCFDITSLREAQLKNAFPEFFDVNAVGTIHRTLQCHIFHFHTGYQTLLDLLSTDRDGHSKGLVQLDLEEVIRYHDQK